MFETIETSPGPNGFNALKNAITELRKSYKGLITVAMPSSTSTIFMRKQFEDEFHTFFGIRFYSQSEMCSMIQTSDQTDFIFQKSNLFENIVELKKISDTIYKENSTWMKINPIEATLSILNGINTKQLNLLENINPIAFNCVRIFNDLHNHDISDLQSFQNQVFDSIFGKIIIVTIDSISDNHEALVDKTQESIHVIINQRLEPKFHIDESFVFENAFDEANVILDLALIATDNTSLSNMAIVIPNEAQKQLLIAIARSKGIPISGSDSVNAYDSQLMLATRFLLENKDSIINEYFVEEFYSQFEWLRSSNKIQNSYSLISLCRTISNSSNLKDLFLPIEVFLEKGYSKLTYNLNVKEIEFIDSQFSILKQICESDEKINNIEAIFLLNKLCSPISKRLDTLGNGIYICKPTEILGSSFNKLFITSFNVAYLNEEPQINSLLNSFEIDSIGATRNIILRNREMNDLIINWLFNCSEQITVSTSIKDSRGSTLLQNVNFDEIFSSATKVKKLDIKETSYEDIEQFDSQAKYYEEFFNKTFNDKNLLINKNRIASFTATGIETLATCPFKFFITRMLKGKKVLEDEDIDIIAAMDRGNIIHEALEKVGLDKFDLDNISFVINEKISELLKLNMLPNSIAGTINKIEVMKLIDTCMALHQQKINQGSNIYSVEEKINGKFKTIIGDIEIKGKIDRIDINSDNTYSIIDYKTGKLYESADFFDFGKRLQLGIYATLLEEQLNLKTIEYWYFNNPDEIIVRQEVTEELVEKVKELVNNITSIAISGIIAPRNYSIEQKKLKTKSAEKSEKDNCENCEVSNICFTEHQELWKSIPHINKYRQSTGENIKVSDLNQND